MDRNQDRQMKPLAVLIAGPTASGKTALSIELAKRLDAQIINADSMQIYEDLRILSACPSEEEEAQAEHVMFGHVPSSEAYSVMRWLNDVEGHIKQAREQEKPIIIVGGTGLYFKSALEGLSLMPDIPEDIRAHWREEGEKGDVERLHAILSEKDPEVAARLKPADKQRVVRALEVIDGTGHSLAFWQNERSEPLLSEAETVRLTLDPDRKALHERIAMRFDMMMDQGAMEEAVALMAKGLDPSLTVMKAIGVWQLAAANSGEMSLHEAIEKSKTETRRYAKRQSTFFRGQLGEWDKFNPLNSHEIAKAIESTLEKFEV